MNQSVKRCRQLSIFEGFQNARKEKRLALMEDKAKADMREQLASAAEKRINHNNTPDDTGATDNSTCEESTTEIQLSQSTMSDDLFPDDCLSSQEWAEVNESISDTEKIYELNRSPTCSATLPTLTPSSNHTILFRPHFRDGCPPRPYPDAYRDRWDSDHVRMPCSPLNRYPVEFPDGRKIIQSRWDLIRESLSQKIESSIDLENAIMRYNSQYISRWNFHGLHAFLNKSLKAAQKTFFFEVILPGMIQLALQLPEICTQPIPLLKKHVDHAITLSQKQIGSLLANAFFCTFPRRNMTKRDGSEYLNYPDINFNRLFGEMKDGITQRKAEKLKCLLNYFLRITTKEPCGTVTFHRKYQRIFPNWAASNCSIRKAVIASNGVIEKDGHGMLQMDFADSFVGGGVIGRGCVQEEIRFVMCPELIVSRLFTEQLTDSEALIMTGAEQYNRYSGYLDTFTWDGDYEDNTARDPWGRRYAEVVAIDALRFRNPNDQYKLSVIKRDLNKAYVGFLDDSQTNLPAVATGNWGCGVFRGHPTLKFLIQLMAAAQCGRDLLYFTFKDRELKKTLENMYELIIEKKLTVGSVWSLLSDYCINVMEMHSDYRPTLYQYICGVHTQLDKDAEPDVSETESSQETIQESQDEETEETEDSGILIGDETETY